MRKRRTDGRQVVQKAFEHILKEQRDKLVEELRGRVLDCVKDSNGNHVIQVLSPPLAPSIKYTDGQC